MSQFSEQLCCWHNLFSQFCPTTKTMSNLMSFFTSYILLVEKYLSTQKLPCLIATAFSRRLIMQRQLNISPNGFLHFLSIFYTTTTSFYGSVENVIRWRRPGKRSQWRWFYGKSSHQLVPTIKAALSVFINMYNETSPRLMKRPQTCSIHLANLPCHVWN